MRSNVSQLALRVAQHPTRVRSLAATATGTPLASAAARLYSSKRKDYPEPGSQFTDDNKKKHPKMSSNTTSPNSPNPSALHKSTSASSVDSVTQLQHPHHQHGASCGCGDAVSAVASAVAKGAYPVPRAPRPSEQTPTRDVNELLHLNNGHSLAPVPPGGAHDGGLSNGGSLASLNSTGGNSTHSASNNESVVDDTIQSMRGTASAPRPIATGARPGSGLARNGSIQRGDPTSRIRESEHEGGSSAELGASPVPGRLMQHIPTTFSNLNNLLEANKTWASSVQRKRPNFFKELSDQQSPQILWVGCSDSRVPANQIINLQPGEVFVHRNIANVVQHTDLNCLSVIQYAVDVLRVKHIIVVGHYGCGGVVASMTSRQYGLIDNWLRAIKDVYKANEEKIEALPDQKARVDLMCELNVAQSVRNVCATTIVQNAWQRKQELSVHGWCYRLEDGIIRDLDLCVSGPSQISRIYDTVGEKRAAKE
ncbi:hypothetical protein H9P43_004488 [Blastocladiella emersonii ATCC 22665]|nr:hypothetical protein H9P43_004488 [Blastocladiella emersonii ATCC 22665]